jgi:hypothetical protein
MSYNGSGTFVINSTGQPVVTGTVISSTAFNALTADLATGLSTALTKDGQTTPTGNLPMGTFKFTGMGAGSAATDSATIAQVQSSFGSFMTVSGTDTITATVSPALTAYAAGQMFAFVAGNTNTGAVTINISSLGAKSITKNGTTALVASDLVANYLYVIVYDGTQFQVVGVSSTTFSNLTVSGVLTLSGAGVQLNSTGTGAWKPPSGTTAQRPGSPSPGTFRWNSELGQLECWDGGIWAVIVSNIYAGSYLVVAGGGGGGGYYGGGAGGGGGLLTGTVSLAGGTSYTITVGAGGTGTGTEGANGTSGANSVFTGVATATGGGRGGGGANAGASGGSGGGGGATAGAGGAGTSGQGFAGGSGNTASYYGGGGGGGGSAIGGNGSGVTASGGAGGAGASNSVRTGSAVVYSGGGGGGSNLSNQAAGGSGGGGVGGYQSATAGAGTANLGGGGGGGGHPSYPTGGNGGSGLVVITYVGSSQRASGGTVTSFGSGVTTTWVHSFTTSGTFTA